MWCAQMRFEVIIDRSFCNFARQFRYFVSRYARKIVTLYVKKKKIFQARKTIQPQTDFIQILT